MEAQLECPRCGSIHVRRKKIHVDPQWKDITVGPWAWGFIGFGLLFFLYAALDAMGKSQLLPTEIYIHNPMLETLLGVVVIIATILSEVLPVFIMPPRQTYHCDWCGKQWDTNERSG